MERIRSRTAFALGGAWRGALAAVGLLAGVGCTGSHSLSLKHVLPASWVASKPATQITPAFNPQLQYLPDPTQDGTMRPGLAGQMFVLANDGSFTEANGDLYVMAEDITQRPPGMPQQVMEVWHFDAATLRKMRTKDERFGECYALFLPYPSNWKDVSQIRIITQYKPKGDPVKEPALSGPPQTLLLDFTPPGQQPGVWLKTGEKTTSPVEMRAMPNVARDIARSGLGAPHTGPAASTNPTVPVGGMTPPMGTLTPPTGLIAPAGGPLPPAGMPPLIPPPNTAPQASSNTPPLPPPIQFTPENPQTTVRGPNGEKLNVTAMALPPGQSVPAGWSHQADGSIQPQGVGATVTAPVGPAGQQPQGLMLQQQQMLQLQQQQLQQLQTQQSQQQWPQTQPGSAMQSGSKFQPASEKFVPASERHQSRIQHGAFNQPQHTHQSLPPVPQTAMPANRGGLPAIPSVPPGNTPPIPTTPSGVSGPATLSVPPVNPALDPNLPVGGWVTQPNGGVPTVAPPGNVNGPIMPTLTR